MSTHAPTPSATDRGIHMRICFKHETHDPLPSPTIHLLQLVICFAPSPPISYFLSTVSCPHALVTACSCYGYSHLTSPVSSLPISYFLSTVSCPYALSPPAHALAILPSHLSRLVSPYLCMCTLLSATPSPPYESDLFVGEIYFRQNRPLSYNYYSLPPKPLRATGSLRATCGCMVIQRVKSRRITVKIAVAQRIFNMKQYSRLPVRCSHTRNEHGTDYGSRDHAVHSTGTHACRTKPARSARDGRRRIQFKYQNAFDIRTANVFCTGVDAVGGASRRSPARSRGARSGARAAGSPRPRRSIVVVLIVV